jgi:hypothetical protein
MARERYREQNVNRKTRKKNKFRQKVQDEDAES